MYLVILLAAAAILAGVVVVAMGRGGEMALFDRDLPVKVMRLATPGEVAMLKLPFGLIGYQTRAAGEALVAAANLLAQRDAEIVALRREIWRLGGDDQMVVSAESAREFAAPGLVAPGFADEGFADEGVGAVTYTSSSLAAWYDSIGRAGTSEPSGVAPSHGPSPGEQGQDDTSRLDETSLLDEASREDEADPVDEDGRLDEAGRLEETGRLDEAGLQDQDGRS